MNIYIVGNLLVGIDSLPVKLMPCLQKEFPNHNFSELDPTEDMPKEKHLVIIDTAINAEKVSLVSDIDRIMVDKICSLHDFDLGYNLKLMKKFRMVDRIDIICVPPNIGIEEAMPQIRNTLACLS